MKNKAKWKTILDAFRNELPIDEEWFQDRLDQCNSCEFNSKNTPEEKLSVEDKVKIGTGVCDNKEHCTLCGCCVYRKASQKVESCALSDKSYSDKALLKKGFNPATTNAEEKGLISKWNSIAVETRANKELNISSESKSVEKIYLDASGKVYNVQLKETSEDLITFTLRVEMKGGLKISSVKPGCSCTVPVQKVIDSNTIDLEVKLSTKGFSKNAQFSRNITINYYINDKAVNKAVVTLIGRKR